MSYTKKAVSGSLFMLGGAIVSAGLGYAINIVLARSISLVNYGLFFAIFSLLSFLIFIRDCGLNTALTKYVVEFNAKHDFSGIKTVICSTLLFQLFFSAILGGFLFFYSDYLAINFFKNKDAAILLKFCIIYIIISVFAKLESSFFMAFKKFRLLSLLEPARLAISFVALFIFLRYKFLALLLAYIVGWLIVALIFLPFFIRLFNFGHSIKNFKLISKKLFLFGIPVVFTGFGAKIVGYFDSLILTYFSSLAQVGIYNAILPSALIFTFFSGALNSIIFPFVTEFWHKRDLIKLTAGISLIHRYLLVLITPFLLLLFGFSSFFINLLFGEHFVSGASSFQVLLLGVILFSIATINHTIISAIGKPSRVTKIVFFAALINILLNLVLIPYWGIFGAAITTSLSYAFMFALSSFYVFKYTGAKLPVGNWIKTLVVGIVFLALVYLLKHFLVLNVWLELALISLVSFSFYVGLLFLFNLIDIKELKKYWDLALKKTNS